MSLLKIELCRVGNRTILFVNGKVSVANNQEDSFSVNVASFQQQTTRLQIGPENTKSYELGLISVFQ